MRPGSGRPIVGITAMGLEVGGRPTQFVHQEYLDAVVAAGGVPVLVPTSSGVTPSDVLGLLDGLVLSGGGDVTPALYGQDLAPETGGVDAVRDSLEIDLVRQAVAFGVPLLGICRGCQVLNVALGGSLHQELSNRTGMSHMVADRRNDAAHAVTVASGRTKALAADDNEMFRLWVNSVHHQGVDRLGNGLVAVAWSDDGLVEAMIHEGGMALGVQWHPENMHGDPVQRRLWRWLVAEADARSERHRSVDLSLHGQGVNG